MKKTALTSLLLGVYLLVLNGCSVVQVVVSHDSNLEKLRDGEHQFSIGNYAIAEQIFIEVSKNTNKPQTRNIALYNLACTRIMLAEEEIDLLEALDTLSRWRKPGQQFLYEENPDLSVAAIKKQAAYLSEQSEVKKQLAISFQSRLEKKEKELAELQRKLTALETIELELQQKKKPL